MSKCDLAATKAKGSLNGKVKAVSNVLMTAFVLSLVSVQTFASHGGFQTVKTQTQTIQTWLYGIVGVAAIIILLVNVFLVWSKRSTWGEFLTTMGWVLVGGGSITLATFLYGVFA